MPRFRKIPIEVEAVRWTGSNVEEIRAFVGKAVTFSGAEPCLQIHTLEGTMTARRGDWIVQGIHHEFYPCHEVIFSQTFEPADMDAV